MCSLRIEGVVEGGTTIDMVVTTAVSILMVTTMISDERDPVPEVQVPVVVLLLLLMTTMQTDDGTKECSEM
jgi:hypothetical protein